MKLLLSKGEFVDGQFRTSAAQNDDDWADIHGCDDHDLVARAGAGDVDAFAILVRRYTSALYRVACRMLGDKTEAEDVVQETFARLWKGAASWKARDSGLVGWLHRVTMNLCLDYLRRPKLVVNDAIPDIADTAPEPDKCCAEKETIRVLETALASLPDHHRAALVLTYQEGLLNAVAADALDMHIKAFESLLARARRNLRKLLEANRIELGDLEIRA